MREGLPPSLFVPHGYGTRTVAIGAVGSIQTPTTKKKRLRRPKKGKGVVVLQQLACPTRSRERLSAHTGRELWTEKDRKEQR